MTSYPIFKPKKRNLALSTFVGILLIVFSMAVGALVVKYGAVSSSIGIIIFACLLVILFFVFDQYHAHHQEIGKLTIDKQAINIQQGEQHTKYLFEEIKALQCYYYYTSNRFGYLHPLQRIVDLNIQTTTASTDLLCGVQVKRKNLIAHLQATPIPLDLISERRR